MEFKKKGGVVGDLITGTGGLIIITVLVLVVVSTLLGASLLSSATTTLTGTVTNETGSWLNTTIYTVDESTASDFTTLVITGAYNVSEGINSPILSANFTVSDDGFTNATTTTWSNISVSYTYYYTGTDTTYQDTANGMGANLTEGIDNVSGKIPTILLIAAVVLLFGVIVLLIKQAGAMGIGAGGASL